MAILATIKGWFRRGRDKEPPLERPRDLPPPGHPDGLHPHDRPEVQGADNLLRWRGGGGIGGV